MFIAFLLAAAQGFGAGQSESVSSSARGEYLASRGIIIPPKDISDEAYIAQIDYDYPDPVAEAVGLSVLSGNQQLGAQADTEFIHIGLKGRKTEFAELPPLNLVFVVDKSGSMYDADKMAWVQEGLAIFLSKVRERDYVALVAFDDRARVIFPSTRMDDAAKKNRFKQAVDELSTGGGSDLENAISLGYQQALLNFRANYTNRVLLLTDGLAESDGLIEMADSYRKMGINCSTIGVGASFNSALMVNLAKAGGGSSRFISSGEEMEKIFSSELDRMVAAAARDLTVELRLRGGAALVDTWGYENRRENGKVIYTLPTLHNGDYETILAEISLPGNKAPGELVFAEVGVRYTALNGAAIELEPVPVSAHVVDGESPVQAVSNPVVLRSTTMLELAQALSRIGSLYYSAEPLDQPELKERGASPKIEEALALTVDINKRVQNVRRLLGETTFDDEIAILESYIDILGAATRTEASRIAAFKTDTEIQAPVKKRSLSEHLRYLFDELTLALPLTEKTKMAVAGFGYPDGQNTAILKLLDESAVTSMAGAANLSLIERDKLALILEERELGLSGLIDTDEAIKVGQLSAARWILTGTLIDLPESLVVFARVIDVETSEIIAVSQVIMEKDAEIRALL